MDGIARVTVDTYVMEYIMHCMYDTFLKIQKGLHVALSWHREDDTVMLTSTSRPATRDLHQALNRFFVLYNTVKRNLTFGYCQLHGSSHDQLFVMNQLAEKYRRIHVEKSRAKDEIKLWGFRVEIEQAVRFVRKISGEHANRLETPFNDYHLAEMGIKSRPPRRLERLDSFLPRVEMMEESIVKKRTWIQEPTIFEIQLKETLGDVLSSRETPHIVYSKSFEKKLSKLKLALDAQREPKAPSRYSTSEIRRIAEKTKRPKKISTFPKLHSGTKINLHPVTSSYSFNQIHTPIGLTISCTTRDEEFPDSHQVLITEISPSGRLSDEICWMIAKDRAFEIMRIIKLHVSLYGELLPSKVVVTPGFQLPYKRLIHATPPSWEEENVKKSLKQLLSTYKNIFRIADTDIGTDRITIPVLGRCQTAAKVFPELVALSLLSQAIVSSTKFGFRTLRHIRILCSRQTELDYIKSTVFAQVMALKYDPRYLQQQRDHFLKKNGALTNPLQEEELP